MAKPFFTELKSKNFKYTHATNLKTSLSIMTFQDYYSGFKQIVQTTLNIKITLNQKIA